MKTLLRQMLSRLTGAAATQGPPCPATLGEITVTDITGAPRRLDEFQGQVALIVNTASRCGFTSQYSGLEEMYRRFRDRGFVVLGFPSNDFLRQEPGSGEEIKAFCELHFGVSFPLFAKQPVRGRSIQPLFRFLTSTGPRGTRGRVRWNFEKFLVDRSGAVIARWRSITPPSSPSVVQAIEAALGAPCPNSPK